MLRDPCTAAIVGQLLKVKAQMKKTTSISCRLQKTQFDLAVLGVVQLRSQTMIALSAIMLAWLDLASPWRGAIILAWIWVSHGKLAKGFNLHGVIGVKPRDFWAVVLQQRCNAG